MSAAFAGPRPFLARDRAAAVRALPIRVSEMKMSKSMSRASPKAEAAMLTRESAGIVDRLAAGTDSHNGQPHLGAQRPGQYHPNPEAGRGLARQLRSPHARAGDAERRSS